jgi:hypothetical protein
MESSGLSWGLAMPAQLKAAQTTTDSAVFSFILSLSFPNLRKTLHFVACKKLAHQTVIAENC